MTQKRLLFVATVDWFFISHRLPLAIAARDAGYDVTVAAADTGVAQKIIEAGLKFAPLPFARSSVNPLTEARTVFALLRLISRLKPDIVHNISLKPVLYGGIVTALLRTPLVVSAMTGFGHLFSKGTESGLAQRTIKRVLRSLWRRRGAVIILQNEDHAEFLINEQLAAREKIAVIQGAGVDMEKFKPSDFRPEPATVVLPARMLASKGVTDFAEAARILKNQGVDYRFLLVGPADDDNPEALSADDLRALEQTHGVEWLGARSDMPEVLAQSTLVVLPSKYGEGMPKALIEAMASGRPIITTDIPGCRQLVDGGNNGWLVEPGEVEQLAATISAALSDIVQLEEKGERARHFAEEHLSVAQVVRITLQVYDSASS